MTNSRLSRPIYHPIIKISNLNIFRSKHYNTMQRLNYFNPYSGKAKDHEDQFTRGLMALIRLCPSVGTYLYDLFRKKTDDSTIPSVSEVDLQDLEVATQIGTLPEAETYYSIILSDLEHASTRPVERSQRTAIYDGVLRYGSVCFFVEVKPFKNAVWEGQLSPSAKDIPEGAHLHQQPICLTTGKVLNLLTGLLDNPIANATERLLISDFRLFVNNYFPHLNPFDTFASCLTYGLAKRRTEALLHEVAADESLVRYHQGWGHYIDITEHLEIRKIGLLLEKDEKTVEWTGLTIAADFGSTQGQAKAFYANENVTLNNIRAISSAEASGNFHLAKITSNVIHFQTHEDRFDAYFNYWKREGPNLRQLKREDFESHYQTLKNERIIEPSDEEFQQKVMSAKYQDLNICPSVYISRHISRSEVIELEGKGQLKETVVGVMKEILGLLGRPVNVFAGSFDDR